MTRLWNDDRKADFVTAVIPWLVARLLVVVGYVMVKAAADEWAGPRQQFQLDRHLLAWDGDWYRAIAERGYERIPDEAYRFFPLFPMLGRAFGWVIGDALALVVLANVFALAAGMALHRLALDETGDAGVARRSAWLFALFPGAFVLVWGYAESLMLLTAIGVFLALRHKAWWWVAGLSLVAGLARPLGLFLALPILWEATRSWREVPGREWPARFAAVAGAPLGVLAYLTWVQIDGPGFFEPLDQQRQYRGAFVDPFSRLIDAVRDLADLSRLGDAVHPPMAILLIVLTVVVVRRLPVRYSLFTVPLLIFTISAESFNSLERYGLNIFPLVLALALVTERPEAERSAIAIGAAGIAALSALAWVGNYVP